MAWNTPSTWASGTIVTSTFLDQQIKENMEWLGTSHRHSTGTAGEGAGYIGPVAYVDGQAQAIPDAPGNSTLLRQFATGTLLGWQTSASATFFFANSTHTHASTATSTYEISTFGTSLFWQGIITTSAYSNEPDMLLRGSLVTQAVGSAGVSIVAVLDNQVQAFNASAGSPSGSLQLQSQLKFEGAVVYSTNVNCSFASGGTVEYAILTADWSTTTAAGGATWDATLQIRRADGGTHNMFHERLVAASGTLCVGALVMNEWVQK